MLANAPDLDFVPGLLAGDPGRYHQGVTHSFAFAVLGAGLAAPLLAPRGFPPRTAFPLLLAAYLSHLLLDVLGGSDSRPPYGLPLLWPISDVTVESPVPLLMGVEHDLTRGSGAWLRSLFSPFNLLAVALELLLSLPIVLWALWRRPGAPR